MTSYITRTLRMHPVRWVVGALCVLMFVPGLDVGFSGMFYGEGEGFFWNRDVFLGFVREAAPTIIIGTFVFCLLLWFAGLVFRQSFLGITTRKMAYLLTTLVLGPGLLVESFLKSHWGRARPNDTVFFGGDAPFTPPLWIAQECGHNCSFVSGHAAVAFWMCAYGFLLPPPWRDRGIIAGLLCGLFVGMVRVIQGAHFLSDVIFAGAFILIVNAVMAHLMLRPRAAPVS